MGARTQVTFGHEPTGSAAFVPGSRNELVYLRDRGGNEQYQIRRLDIASGTTTLLTDGKSRHTSFLFDHRGQQVLYTSTARNGEIVFVLICVACAAWIAWRTWY